MFDTYRQFLRLRVQWYAVATVRLLQRHWQWLLLAAIFVPMGAGGAAILGGLAYPLMALLEADQGAAWYFGNIMLIQSVAVAWVGLQRRQIRGGSFMNYAGTLPVAAVTRRAVELTLLLLANSILLVPVIAALLVTLADPEANVTEPAGPLLTLLALTLCAQLAALEKSPLAVAAVVLADLPLAASLSLEGGSAAMLLHALALLFASPVLIAPWSERKIPALSPRGDRPHRTEASYRWLRVPAAVLIQLKALASYPGLALLRTSAVLGLVVGAGLLIRAFQFDGRSLPTVVLTMGVMGLIIAGAYRTLYAAHARMRLYQATLPVNKYYWSIRDTLLILCLGSAPGAMLMYPLVSRGLVPMPTLFMLSVAYYALLAALRPALLFRGRQTVLLSVATTAVWTAAVVAGIGD